MKEYHLLKSPTIGQIPTAPVMVGNIMEDKALCQPSLRRATPESAENIMQIIQMIARLVKKCLLHGPGNST